MVSSIPINYADVRARVVAEVTKTVATARRGVVSKCQRRTSAVNFISIVEYWSTDSDGRNESQPAICQVTSRPQSMHTRSTDSITLNRRRFNFYFPKCNQKFNFLAVAFLSISPCHLASIFLPFPRYIKLVKSMCARITAQGHQRSLLMSSTERSAMSTLLVATVPLTSTSMSLLPLLALIHFLNCTVLCCFCIICIQYIIVVNSLWAASFDKQICFTGSPSRCSLIDRY